MQQQETDKPDKTAEALKYYWSVVIEDIHRETGETKTRLHNLFKQWFLGYPEFNAAGELEIMPGTTKGITRENFNNFVTYVIIFAGSELGITIRPARENEIL